MSSQWMRFKEGLPLRGALACIAVAVTCVLFAEYQLSISAYGAELPKPELVPYFVTWHVTARGSGLVQSSRPVDNGMSTDTEAETEFAEATGSAITRFGEYQGNGKLYFQETHYLTFTERENWDTWSRQATPDHICTLHNSRRISDPHDYAGYRAANPSSAGLLQSPPELRNGVAVMQRPFEFLASTNLAPFPIVTHNLHEEYGASSGSSPPCSAYSLSVGDRNAMGGFSNGSDPRLEFQAEPGNPSSFLLHARYSTHRNGSNMNVDVEWTAHAYLMGKCATRNGPIPEGDPIIHNETVDVDADRTEVTAAPPVNSDKGKSHLKIRVTCDQVPIQNAIIEIKVEPQDKSGGHNHSDEDRPRGKLNGKEVTKDWNAIDGKTDATGSLKVDFESPLTGYTYAAARSGPYDVGIAGIYKITVRSKSARSPNSSPPVAITAKVDGLKPMHEGSNYKLCCATRSHPDGFNATTGTSQAFINLAIDFEKYQTLHNVALKESCHKDEWAVQPLSVNDIALPDGGVFDLDFIWRPGKDGHMTHNKGEGGDVNRFGLSSTAGINALGEGIECNGSTVPITAWLLHVVLELGEPRYGHWDCADIATPGCITAEVPTRFFTKKATLHLHVED